MIGVWGRCFLMHAVSSLSAALLFHCCSVEMADGMKKLEQGQGGCADMSTMLTSAGVSRDYISWIVLKSEPNQLHLRHSAEPFS